MEKISKIKKGKFKNSENPYQNETKKSSLKPKKFRRDKLRKDNYVLFTA